MNKQQSNVQCEITFLRDECSKWRRAAMAIGAAVLIAMLAAFSTQASAVDAVKARRFEVVSTDGATVAVLDHGEFGGRLQLFASSGEKYAELDLEKGGRPSFELLNREGKSVVLLASNTSGAGMVACNHQNGSNAFSAGALEYGSFVQLADTDGRYRAGLSCYNGESGALVLGEATGGELSLLRPADFGGAKPPQSESAVIESNIDGEFEGFDYERVYKLVNGQLWQQVSFDISVAMRINPDVLIYESSGVTKMRVDGERRAITVKRLK